ncbi:MAG TPA: Flp family type IVb pilin [Vicinamibacterales bacterium]|nr:Flp family type IVb pilin [Vicinamibacterales bacterium]
MKNLFARFVREEEGQDIIEYALLAAFISVVAWLILQAIGQDVVTMYTNVKQATGDAAGAGGS